MDLFIIFCFYSRWSQRSNSSRIELSVPTMAKELSQQLSDLRSFINARPGHVIDAEELAKFNFQSDNRILIHKSHIIELGAAHGLLWQSSANTEGKILCIPISPKTVNSHSEGMEVSPITHAYMKFDPMCCFIQGMAH